MRQFYALSRLVWQKLPWRVLVVVVCAALAGVAVARTFIVSVSVVSGTSMAPTFKPGAWLYTAPISTPLKRGDVVALNDGSKNLAIKRIIGLPGETVHLWHGFVFVNRKVLREPYVLKNVYTYPTQVGVFLLGQDQYFVLGDNRLDSFDSRNYGPVEMSQIKRRVLAPAGTPRAHFDAYTLPGAGGSVPRPIVSKVEGAKSRF